MPIPTETPTMVLLFNAPDEVAVVDAVSAVVVELGGIDTVVVEVRAAAVGSSGGADVLLKGSDLMTVPVRLMAAVLPSMQDHKGVAFVNVASRAALSGAVAGVAYFANKHGLVGATKNVAWRFHNDGIRCNAVLPGVKCQFA